MKSTTWYVAGFGLACLGVFVLPWHIPFPGPVVGESYSYGFYNPAAVVALALSLVLILLGHWRGGKKPVALSWFLSSPKIFPSWRNGAYEYLVLGVASLLCAAAVLVWNSFLVQPYWGESSYFLSNIDLVRLGFRPYTDFTFIYGPAFLYAPIGVDALSGRQLGSENACAVCVALAFPLGFFLWFVFLRFLNLPDRDRPWILALALLIWCLLLMGLQYTPLRFALAPCFLALGNHAALHRARGPWVAARIATLVLLFVVVCNLISPEMAIACLLGFMASAVIHLGARRLLVGAAYLAGVALSVALLAGFSSHHFQGVSSFGAGGYGLPIFPNHANVALVLAALYLLPAIAYSILSEPTNPAAPLAAGLGTAAIALLPAALGRCDPGHVLFNEVVLFLMLFAALGQIRRSYLVTWGVAFAFLFVVLGQVSYWNFYAAKWREALQLRAYYQDHPDVVAAWSRAWKNAAADSPNAERLNWHKVIPFPQFALALKPGQTRIGAPIGADFILDRYLKIQPAYRPPYCSVLLPEVFTPQGVARLIAETRAQDDFVLVPNSNLSEIMNTLKQPPDGSELQVYLSGLLLYPVRNRFQNDPYIPIVVTAESLLQNSTIAEKDAAYTLIKLSK